MNDHSVISESAKLALIKACITPGLYYSEDHTPSQDDISSMTPSQLSSLMTHWMWDSPKEFLPTRQQIHLVLTELNRRPDKKELQELINECHYYLLIDE